MDEGGTVTNWADMLTLVTAGYEQPIEDFAAAVRERAALGGAV